MLDVILYLLWLVIDVLMMVGGLLFIGYLAYKLIDTIDYSIKRYKKSRRWRGTYRSSRRNY